MVVDCAGKSNVTYYVDAASVPLGVTNDLYKTTKMVMRKIPAVGVTWKMGSPTTETERTQVDGPTYEVRHNVTLTEDYYMGIYPVTQGQYLSFIGSNPSLYNSSKCADWRLHPVERVSYNSIRGNHDVAPWCGNNPSHGVTNSLLVIDSEDLLSLQHADGCEKPACSLDAFVREIARSGVPFDSYLKKDLDAHPAIARAYKAIIPFDSKTKLMGTAEIQRRVREAGGYVPVPECTVSVDINGGFLSVHGLWDREIDFELPFPCRVINLKSGMEEHVSGNKFRIVVKQGETCWFRFVSRF